MAARKPPLGQRVLRYIRENHLVPPGELVVAVSGGPDSVCLLHILAGLREELGTALHVAHLNHRLRGAEADADAEYVSGIARRLGIPATIEPRDVRAYQARHRLSPEEAAREVRYTFLAEVARSIGADRVAVGHTVDDHIETILMHLLRGTGTRGLRGLQPLTRWRLASDSTTVVRPLLAISHKETAGYCARHRLAPRLDASNLLLSPLRNRVRQQLLPLLRSYNPGIDGALLRTARIAGDDNTFLDEQVALAWDRIAGMQESTVVLDKAGFLQLPAALKRYLLRAAIEKLAGNVMDIETRHIDVIMAALTRPAGRRLNLPSGLTFAIDYDRLLIGRDPGQAPFPALEGELPVAVPGETRLPGWRLESALIAREEMTESGDFTAYLDLAKSGDRLGLRNRRPGDRFQPLGMGQTKKLGEFMIDAKIPRPWRRCVPLVCSREHIIWVVGWRIDDRVKVDEDTRQVLRLKFEPD